MLKLKKLAWLAALLLALSLVFIGCDNGSNDDIVDAAKALLQTRIDHAKGLLDETQESADGEGVDEGKWWAPGAAITALKSAISAAETVYEEGQTIAEVNAGREALNTAIETFRAARTGGVDKTDVSYVGEMEPFTDEDPPDFGNSTVNMELIEVDDMDAWRFTGNVTTQFQYGFVGWEHKPDEETLKLLKTASAISFMAKGDGKRYTVKYRISSVTDHAHYEFHFIAGANASRITVPVTAFVQPGWGVNRPMNQDLAEDISWQTHEEWRPGSFGITIWDVRVIQ